MPLQYQHNISEEGTKEKEKHSKQQQRNTAEFLTLRDSLKASEFSVAQTSCPRTSWLRRMNRNTELLFISASSSSFTRSRSSSRPLLADAIRSRFASLLRPLRFRIIVSPFLLCFLVLLRALCLSVLISLFLCVRNLLSLIPLFHSIMTRWIIACSPFSDSLLIGFLALVLSHSPSVFCHSLDLFLCQPHFRPFPRRTMKRKKTNKEET